MHMAVDLRAIFASRANQLTWKRFDDSHIADPANSGTLIEKDQAYFSIRLKEMYVGYSRKLWVKFFPMLYSFVAHGSVEQNAVAGLGQLREFGESNLERVINLNYALTSPIVYTGEDVNMLVGLYSVRGEDTAAGLIELTASLATLAGLATGIAVEATNLVKKGVEKILGLNDSVLQLGVRDTFNADMALSAGSFVGINAPADSINFDRLWLKDGHLLQGEDPVVGKPFRERDYMVVEVARLDYRPDWPRLPGLLDFEARFNVILREADRSTADKRKALNVAFAEFREALATSKQLTMPDRANIANNVAHDLRQRIANLGDPLFKDLLFEEKGALHVLPHQRAVLVDFGDVNPVTDFDALRDVGAVRALFDANPFS
jgi:hypothetical protein